LIENKRKTGQYNYFYVSCVQYLLYNHMTWEFNLNLHRKVKAYKLQHRPYIFTKI